MRIEFESITLKNFFSYGAKPTLVDLKKHPLTLITGKNGGGKCLDKNTKLNIIIDNPEIEKIFLDFLKNK